MSGADDGPLRAAVRVRWQYAVQTVHMHDSMAKTLAMFGDAGWELVQALRDDQSPHWLHLFFKRPDDARGGACNETEQPEPS